MSKLFLKLWKKFWLYLSKITLNQTNSMNLYNQPISDFIATGRRVPKFMSLEMISSNKAFILPHLEYCAPVLVGLLSGLSN